MAQGRMPVVSSNQMPGRLHPAIAIGSFVVSAAGSAPCEERAGARVPFLGTPCAVARITHRRANRFHGAP
jgi:hypothetical protein